MFTQDWEGNVWWDWHIPVMIQLQAKPNFAIFDPWETTQHQFIGTKAEVSPLQTYLVQIYHIIRIYRSHI